MGNPSALPTPTRQPVVVYRVDLGLLARVHAAHAQSAEHAAALAWGEQARQRLQAASERRQRQAA